MKLKFTNLLSAFFLFLAACVTETESPETVNSAVRSDKLEGQYKVTFVLDTARLQGEKGSDNLGATLALGMLEMIKINVDFQPDNIAVFEVKSNQLMKTQVEDGNAACKWKIEEGKLSFYDFEGIEEGRTNFPSAFSFDDFDGNYTQFDLVAEDTAISDMIKAWRFTKLKKETGE